jgi:hypothetical protein
MQSLGAANRDFRDGFLVSAFGPERPVSLPQVPVVFRGSRTLG